MNEQLTKLKNKLSAKKPGKDLMLILILGGVLLAVIAWPTEDKNTDDESKSIISDNQSAMMEENKESMDSQTLYEKKLEERLEEILAEVEGVGKVKVMITLAADSEQIVEKDRTLDTQSVSETDGTGGSRENRTTNDAEETVYITNQSGEKEPYVSKVKYPTVEGVLVVAEGGDDIRVNIHITEAIQALFHIDAHKIRVVKMKS